MATTKDTSHVQIIGRVLPNPRGQWNETIQYERLDFVVFQGNGYICRESNMNEPPSIFESSWTLVCGKGEKGDKGDKGPEGTGIPIYRGEFDMNDTYNKNDVVEYNGSSWVCMKDEVSGISPEGGITFTVKDDVYPVWRLSCKGVEYQITKDGEVIFYNHSSVTGVKTYSTNVYIKNFNSKTGATTEQTLQSKIDDLERRLKKVESILDKYSLD